MRVVVDLAVCQGYAQCAFLAPDAFRLSGPEGLMYDPGPDDEQRARILRAAAACPVQAISVEQPQPAAAAAGSEASPSSEASHGR
jgi:ferredoxin